MRTGLWAIVLVVGSLPFMSIAVTKGQFSLVSLGALFLAIRLVVSLPTLPNHALPGFHPRKEQSNGTIFRASLAGIFLAFSILKPTLTVPAVAGILLWAIIERKGFIVAGFVACIGVLSLASWIAVGNWVPDYLQLLKNTGGAPVLWSLTLLAWPWEAIYALLFIGIGIYAFIRFIRTRPHAMVFGCHPLWAGAFPHALDL